MKKQILIILLALILSASSMQAGWFSSAAEWMWSNSGKTLAIAAATIGCVYLAVKYRATKMHEQNKKCAQQKSLDGTLLHFLVNGAKYEIDALRAKQTEQMQALEQRPSRNSVMVDWYAAQRNFMQQQKEAYQDMVSQKLHEAEEAKKQQEEREAKKDVIKQKLLAQRQQQARNIKTEVEQLYTEFSVAAAKKSKNHRATIFNKGQAIAQKCKIAFVGDQINTSKAQFILSAGESSIHNTQVRKEFCEAIEQVVEQIRLLAL